MVQKQSKKQADDDLLTMSEICDLYRVGRDVVRKWIGSGELPALNVSTSQNAKSPRWRVRRGDLTTFLESRSATALAEEQRQAVTQIPEPIGTLKWDPKNCTLNFVREEKRQENENPANRS